jgi:hypothetical protein
VLGFAPAGEIIFVKVLAGFAEPVDDGGIGEVVQEHEVDLLADMVRQSGDFANPAALEDEVGGTMEGFEHGGEDL